MPTQHPQPPADACVLRAHGNPPVCSHPDTHVCMTAASRAGRTGQACTEADITRNMQCVCKLTQHLLWLTHTWAQRSGAGGSPTGWEQAKGRNVSSRGPGSKIVWPKNGHEAWLHPSSPCRHCQLAAWTWPQLWGTGGPLDVAAALLGGHRGLCGPHPLWHRPLQLHDCPLSGARSGR